MKGNLQNVYYSKVRGRKRKNGQGRNEIVEERREGEGGQRRNGKGYGKYITHEIWDREGRKGKGRERWKGKASGKAEHVEDGKYERCRVKREIGKLEMSEENLEMGVE